MDKHDFKKGQKLKITYEYSGERRDIKRSMHCKVIAITEHFITVMKLKNGKRLYPESFMYKDFEGGRVNIVG